MFRTKEIVVGEKPLAFAKSRIVIIAGARPGNGFPPIEFNQARAQTPARGAGANGSACPAHGRAVFSQASPKFACGVSSIARVRPRTSHHAISRPLLRSSDPKQDPIERERLALEGGFRFARCPAAGFPGMHYLDEVAMEAVVRVLKSRWLFPGCSRSLESEGCFCRRTARSRSSRG